VAGCGTWKKILHPLVVERFVLEGFGDPLGREKLRLPTLPHILNMLLNPTVKPSLSNQAVGTR